jgi:hypothetical protein
MKCPLPLRKRKTHVLKTWSSTGGFNYWEVTGSWGLWPNEEQNKSLSMRKFLSFSKMIAVSNTFSHFFSAQLQIQVYGKSRIVWNKGAQIETKPAFLPVHNALGERGLQAVTSQVCHETLARRTVSSVLLLKMWTPKVDLSTLKALVLCGFMTLALAAWQQAWSAINF